jgi:esterase
MPAAVDLSFDRVGVGPVLVILHGLFGSKRNWQSIARKLSTNFSVLSVDLRNHGDSPHCAGMDYAEMAGDIGRLLETLGIDDVNLLGHSMGGKAAMTYALTDARHLKRLIVVDIAPRAYRNEYAEFLAGMKQLDRHTIGNRANADAALAPFIAETSVRQFVLQNLRFRPGATPEWQLNLDAIDASIGALVGAIPVDKSTKFNGKSFFIRGANSNRIDVQDFESIGDHFPGYRDFVISNAGHWPHAENPGMFIDVLQRILCGESD